MPTPTAFEKHLALTATQQFDKYHLQHEHDLELAKQIQKYWIDLGFAFHGVATAWSAVFVSWCVKSAGATAAEFDFAEDHSAFVHRAIQNTLNNVGLFRALEISAYAPQVGDIIQNNRDGHQFDYAYASSNTQYESHSAIVVETGQDSQGNYLKTIGGNEGNSVGMKLIRLTNVGLIKQRPNSSYICVIQDLK